MTKQQIQKIRWVTFAGAIFLSVTVPVLLTVFDVGGELTLAIFAPGLLLMSPVHNLLPALIVTLVVNALVYWIVAELIVSAVLRIMRNQQQPTPGTS